MVEIKAVTKLEDVYMAQAKNYLEAYKTEVGLLINFGGRSLEIKDYITITRIKPGLNQDYQDLSLPDGRQGLTG